MRKLFENPVTVGATVEQELAEAIRHEASARDLKPGTLIREILLAWHQNNSAESAKNP